MHNKHGRKPISNFFIKKKLQMRMMKKIIFAVIVATLVCVATLLITYLVKYKSAVFYRVTFDMDASIGNRENIISIILPSLIISGIVNIGIGILIGLYASRKYALPIFKLEQWVELLQDGCMTVKLNFREKAEMQELCDECNNLSESLRKKFDTIQTNLLELEKDNQDSEALQKIQKVLDTMVLRAEPFKIQTNYIMASKIPTRGKKMEDDDTKTDVENNPE